MLRAASALFALMLPAMCYGSARVVALQQPGCDFDLSGNWIGTNGLRYDIEQKGARFSWAAPDAKERGAGVCRGAALSARWQGSWGTGAAEGRVQDGRGNLAIALLWSNGVVFRRIPKLSLRGAPVLIRAGETTRFEIQIDPPGMPGFDYSIRFGDGRGAPLTEPSIAHRYEQPGSYSAVALAETAGRAFESNAVRIGVKNQAPPPDVRLEADRADCLVGEEIRLRAFLEPGAPGAEFRFVFGKQETPWSPQPEARLRCDEEGVVGAQATVRFGPPTFAAQLPGLQSTPVQVRVERLRVSLQPLSALVIVGRPLRVEAVSQPARGDLLYSFRFGEEVPTRWLPEPAASHVFERPGGFPVQVRARTGGVLATSDPITVLAVELALDAAPLRPEIGQEVHFQARSSPQLQRAEYLFHFGERADYGWTTRLAAVHTYRSAGSYPAFVEVRLDQGPPVQTDPVVIRIAQAAGGTRWPPWLLLVPLLAVLAVSYVALRNEQRRRKLKARPRLDFRSHRDPGRQSTGSDEAPVLEAEIRLRPVRDPGLQSAILAPRVKKEEPA